MRSSDVTCRSSRPEVFLENNVLKICSKFSGEHPCQSAISVKLQSNFIERFYLRYKTIISHNVSSEAHVKNFLTFLKTYVPFSRYSSFCIFSHDMIYHISDVMKSITI